MESFCPSCFLFFEMIIKKYTALATSKFSKYTKVLVISHVGGDMKD